MWTISSWKRMYTFKMRWTCLSVYVCAKNHWSLRHHHLQLNGAAHKNKHSLQINESNFSSKWQFRLVTHISLHQLVNANSLHSKMSWLLLWLKLWSNRATLENMNAKQQSTSVYLIQHSWSTLFHCYWILKIIIFHAFYTKTYLLCFIVNLM